MIKYDNQQYEVELMQQDPLTGDCDFNVYILTSQGDIQLPPLETSPLYLALKEIAMSVLFDNENGRRDYFTPQASWQLAGRLSTGDDDEIVEIVE